MVFICAKMCYLMLWEFFYVQSYFEVQLRQIFGRDYVGRASPPKGWNLLKHKWPDEDLKYVRGFLLKGNLPWHEVDYVRVSITSL